MWYFAWILGIFMACFFSIIVGLWLENRESSLLDDSQ